jgi:hypothetical protein
MVDEKSYKSLQQNRLNLLQEERQLRKAIASYRGTLLTANVFTGKWNHQQTYLRALQQLLTEVESRLGMTDEVTPSHPVLPLET